MGWRGMDIEGSPTLGLLPRKYYMDGRAEEKLYRPKFYMRVHH